LLWDYCDYYLERLYAIAPEFRDGKFHGEGTYTFADGSKYVGEFSDDKYHGQGIYTYANGTVQEGVWKDNVFQYARNDPKVEERREAEREAEGRKNEKTVTASRSNQTDRNFERAKAEYDRLKNKKKDTASATEPDAASSGDDPLEAKLEKLQKLLDKGLITEEEAAAKRAKLLEDM
jgi:hypothetical protein